MQKHKTENIFNILISYNVLTILEEHKENLNHSFQEMYFSTKLQVHNNKNMKRRQIKRNENIPCQSIPILD